MSAAEPPPEPPPEPSPEPPPEGRIVCEESESLLLIVIDRPRKLNAFSPEMLHQLAAAFTRLEMTNALRCGVLASAGRNFTAGLELDKLGPVMAAGRSLFAPQLVDPTGLCAPGRTKPLVCAVRGICFTLGVELMLAADIVIAADDCRFAQIEISRGIMPSQGSTIRMVERAGWGNAQRYLLTGDEFGASEAYRIGLVQEVTPAGHERERAIAIARRISEQAPLAVQASLASSRRYNELGHLAAVADLAAAQVKLARSQDYQEGVRSFVERRKGDFQGR